MGREKEFNDKAKQAERRRKRSGGEEASWRKREKEVSKGEEREV